MSDKEIIEQLRKQLAAVTGYNESLTLDLRRAQRARDQSNKIAVSMLEKCIALDEMTAEYERVKRGDFTPAEFQNLCHKIDKPCTAREFADGCAAYQRQLFGSAPDADESEEWRRRDKVERGTD